MKKLTNNEIHKLLEIVKRVTTEYDICIHEATLLVQREFLIFLTHLEEETKKSQNN